MVVSSLSASRRAGSSSVSRWASLSSCRRASRIRGKMSLCRASSGPLGKSPCRIPSFQRVPGVLLRYCPGRPGAPFLSIFCSMGASSGSSLAIAERSVALRFSVAARSSLRASVTAGSPRTCWSDLRIRSRSATSSSVKRPCGPRCFALGAPAPKWY